MSARNTPAQIAAQRTFLATALVRQRYECTCGWHGTREQHAPPAHLKCPRCMGVAVARGLPEPILP